MKKLCLLMAFLAVAMLSIVPATAYYENFDGFANGELAGQGGWLGNAGVAAIDNGAVKLTYDHGVAPGQVIMSGLNITAPLIDFSFDIYGGNEDGWSNAFDFYAQDETGKEFGRWYGGATWMRPRVVNIVGNNESLTMSDWDNLRIRFNTVDKTGEWFVNGTSVWVGNYGGQSAGISNTLDRVSIGLQFATTGVNGHYLWIDNVSVTAVPEPSSFMALGMFGLGALGYIKRRRA